MIKRASNERGQKSEIRSQKLESQNPELKSEVRIKEEVFVFYLHYESVSYYPHRNRLGVVLFLGGTCGQMKNNRKLQEKLYFGG